MTTAQQTGEITLPLGGQPRTIAFNMGTLIGFSGLYKGGLTEAFQAMADNELVAMAQLVYFGLRARKHVNELPAHFDEDLATEWIGELMLENPEGFKQLAGALADSLQAVGNKQGATAKKKAA